MQKRISKKPAKKARRDSNEIAYSTIQKTIEAAEAEAPKFDKATISEVMRQLGTKGGKIGGKRRLETMTQEERTAIASRAARKRWDNQKKK